MKKMCCKLETVRWWCLPSIDYTLHTSAFLWNVSQQKCLPVHSSYAGERNSSNSFEVYMKDFHETYMMYIHQKGFYLQDWWACIVLISELIFLCTSVYQWDIVTWSNACHFYNFMSSICICLCFCFCGGISHWVKGSPLLKLSKKTEPPSISYEFHWTLRPGIYLNTLNPTR